MASDIPTKNWQWPGHANGCPGAPGMKGICECGAEPRELGVAIDVPADLAQLRRDRDQLARRLAIAHATLEGHDEDVPGCPTCALLARVRK